jgi:hypothetical protein
MIEQIKRTLINNEIRKSVNLDNLSSHRYYYYYIIDEFTIKAFTSGKGREGCMGLPDNYYHVSIISDGVTLFTELNEEIYTMMHNKFIKGNNDRLNVLKKDMQEKALQWK